MQPTSGPAAWRTTGIVAVFWSLMALVSAAQTYYVYGQMPGAPSPARVIYLASSYSILWALATPFVFLLARSFPVDKGAFAYNLPFHLLASIALGMFHRATWLWLQMMIPVMRPKRAITWDTASSDLIGSVDYQAMVYWVLLAIHQGTLYYRKYEQGRTEAAQLEAQLAQAQLAGLKMQLQPHFLFNTLHGINALMYQNVNQASEMLVRLSEFLRASLQSSNAQEVTLSEELDFIQQYLDIERIRFEERLQVDYFLEDAALSCLVPNMILQPLVENAIQHGISRTSGGGRIEIHAKILASERNQSLQIIVANIGPALTSNNKSGSTSPSKQDLDHHAGIGLANTKARLHTLYGDRQSFLLRNWQQGGVEAVLCFPGVCALEPQDGLANDFRQGRVSHESSHRG